MNKRRDCSRIKSEKIKTNWKSEKTNTELTPSTLIQTLTKKEAIKKKRKQRLLALELKLKELRHLMQFIHLKLGAPLLFVFMGYIELHF